METVKKHAVIKKIITAYCIVMLAWFAAPAAVGILNLGNLTGIAVFLAAVVYCLKTDKINKLIVNLYHRTAGKILLISAGALAAVIAVTTLSLTILMTAAAYKKPAEDSVLIVLGCRVYGENASMMLSERVDAACDYLSKNDGAVCILSGGKGDDEDISEAECMRRIMISRGISEQRLYIEDKSRSTRENMLFSKQIIDDNGLSDRNIAIATSEFHQFRAHVIAEKLGMDAASVSGKSELYLLPSYYVRELYGILYEFIF